MMKRFLMAAGIAAALSMPALAADDAAQAAKKEDKATCQTMMQELDKLVQEKKLDEGIMQQVEKTKQMAAEQMKAGDEAGCQATIGKVIETIKG